MIKDTGGKFDDYSISPNITQILLHWGYEIKESDIVSNLCTLCLPLLIYFLLRYKK